jgi:hypothetical protein
MASGWIQNNPAKILKKPIVTDPPTLPFSDAEVQRILMHVRGKWRALTLVLLHSGYHRVRCVANASKNREKSHNAVAGSTNLV